MRVLVTAASKHGSTAEVATRIAEALRMALPGEAVVEVCPAVEVADVAPHDAVVLGSAVYMGRLTSLWHAWGLARAVDLLCGSTMAASASR